MRIEEEKEAAEEELKKIEKRIEEAREELEEIEKRKEQHEAMIEKMKEEKTTQISLTDPESKLMKNNGIDTFIEIGTGKTMSGFVKKDLKDLDIKCYQTENLEQLENTICEIKNMEG